MKSIAVLNLKGGVGKSTVAVNLAHAFALTGNKTALLDLDYQNDSALFLGISSSQYRKTFFDLFDRHNPARLEECLLPVRENLDLIPNENLDKIIDELHQHKRIDRVLDDKLKNLEKMGYEYLIIDCSPVPHKVNDAVLCYVKNIVMPVQLQAASIRAIGNIYKYLGDLSLPSGLIKAVVPNMYRTGTNDSRDNLLFLQQWYEEEDPDIITGIVYATTRIAEAGKAGKTFFEYDQKLASEFLDTVFAKVVERIE